VKGFSAAKQLAADPVKAVKKQAANVRQVD
jgi:hypothetical protein